MKNINTETLLKIHNSKYEYVIILKDNTIIETNEDDTFEGYQNNCTQLDTIIFTSDMEIMFEVQNELRRREIIE